MPQTLTKVETVPPWIHAFSDEIDELRFGAGFAKIGTTTPWSFGVTTGTGVEDLKTFFRKIDGELDTAHRLLECWSGPDIHIVRGDALVAPEDGSKPTITVPFVWIFRMTPDATDELESIYIVNGPVQTEHVV